MEKLLEDIDKVEFTTGTNFSYDLDREFKLIASKLEPIQKKYLKSDFNRFLEKGRFAVLNAFGGGILFLKVPESIEKIKIESLTDSKGFKASVLFNSEFRRIENTKYKPDAGRIESTRWNVELIFPNFFEYAKEVQIALLLIIGKIVKRICEYGRTNFAYMKIENEFQIELLIDNRIESKLKVEIK
ncbi:hypothetical protein [uncultured Dokdonia sp.]|uniref:hypothetical protein n=1 Tax=uncultured Dokdonia sp. TaxID=575653 RepID=UPI002621E9A5|nr:hypothetical protein [uncultured Dokdonia sp.]